MRLALTVAFVGLLGWSGSLLSAEPPDSKFLAEMEKCAVCKSMAENPELMREMTWETHKIENGMLCMATVPKELAKDFAVLHEKMMQNVAKVEADQKRGTKVELCSFCQAISELEKAGAKQEVIRTATGAISLLTSSDPDVVKQIHAQADKVIAEQKALKRSVQVPGA